MQARKCDAVTALEALCNAAIGLVVSWTLTLTVLGYTPMQSAGITLMFFAVSTVRAFLIREAFRRTP